MLLAIRPFQEAQNKINKPFCLIYRKHSGQYPVRKGGDTAALAICMAYALRVYFGRVGILAILNLNL